MNEYILINKYIKPVVYNNKEALSLADDIAFINKPTHDTNQIITTDCMIEDVHFLKDEDPKSIAYRLIISSLSDLSSKGCTPKYFTLTFCPKTISNLEDWWLKSFFYTIEVLQNKYNIKLVGGNISSTYSKLMLSVTLIGEISKAYKDLPFRFNANVEDEIYMSGFLGDAYLGYCIIAADKQLESKPNWLKFLSNEEIDYLVNQYYYPQISLELGQDLLNCATSCTDASDGVVNSVFNIGNSSKTSFDIKLSLSLFSQVTKKIISVYKPFVKEVLPKLVNWGGDYNLVFTVPNKKKSLLKEVISKYKNSNINISYLGKITPLSSTDNCSIKITDINNNILLINTMGYIHK